MTTELTSRSQSSKHPAVLKLMDGDPFAQRMTGIYDTLARRAYELFEGRGCQDGHDLEDWFRAESELLNPMPVEISEAEDQLIVRAEVPGFRDKDIEMRVEPHRLTSAESGNRFVTRRSGRLSMKRAASSANLRVAYADR